MKQIRAFRNRALRKNRRGGIEGLPLQLMIVIIIASLGLAMMVGWMGNIEEPKAIGDIESSVTEQQNGRYGDTYTMTVTVYDMAGNPVEGADVLITGLGAKAQDSGVSGIFGGHRSTADASVPHGVTGSDGTLRITFSLNTSVDYGYLNIDVSKSGYSGNSTQVLVTL